MARIEMLRQVPFLRSLPETALCELAGFGRERSLTKGEMLIAERTPCVGLIIILAGAVKTYKLDRRGREITLSLEYSGASVEEIPLFDGGNYPASAEAYEDNTRVLIIPRDRFLEMMAKYPVLAQHAVRALAIRIRKQIQIIEAYSFYTVRARLASYILRIASNRNKFLLEETNEEIGSHVGSVRDVVSRTLSGLKDAGLINVEGRTITILNREELNRVAITEDE